MGMRLQDPTAQCHFEFLGPIVLTELGGWETAAPLGCSLNPLQVDIDRDRLGLRRFWSGMGFPAHESGNGVRNKFHGLESPCHFWMRP